MAYGKFHNSGQKISNTALDQWAYVHLEIEKF